MKSCCYILTKPEYCHRVYFFYWNIAVINLIWLLSLPPVDLTNEMVSDYIAQIFDCMKPTRQRRILVDVEVCLSTSWAEQVAKGGTRVQ